MNIISLLANDNYIIANKDIAKMYGLDSAILLGELASEYSYWFKQGELKDGYFYSTIENVKDNTTLSAKRQRNALKILENAKIINTKRQGLPAKRYIKINADQLCKLIDNVCQNGNTSCAKMAQLETPKRQINNNNITIINKINDNGDDTATKNTLSEKEEVIKDTYFDCYYSFFGKKHHSLNHKSIATATARINKFITTLISEYDLDIDYLDLLIDMATHFFETVSSTDHSIIHFSEIEILKNRVYSLYPKKFDKLEIMSDL